MEESRMKHEEHRTISLLVFGNEYPEIHKWIDAKFWEYAKVGLSFYHWKERHHKEAIKKKYGEGTEEYKVACLHIVMDWYAHGMKVFKLPENGKEVTELLDEALST